MKKLITLLCVLLVLAVCSVEAFAESGNGADRLGEYSAASVGETVLQQLNAKDGDTVLKTYNCGVVMTFGKYPSVEDVLLNGRYLQIIYAVKRKGAAENDWSFYSYYDGELVRMYDNDSSFTGVIPVLKYLKDDDFVKETTGAKVVINKFLFFNPTMHQGTAIYYQTDKGDYVYYNRSNTGNYLFTAERFFAIVGEAYSKMGPDVPPGGGNYMETVDLSAYNVDSPDFKLESQSGSSVIIWVVIALAASAAAAVFVILTLKKRKAKNA